MATRGPYLVQGLDDGFYELSSTPDLTNLTEAKEAAKLMFNDNELRQSGLFKVEVLNAKAECEFDFYVR